MENNIRIEEVSTLRRGPFHFTRDKQEESFPRQGRSPKRDYSPKRDNNSKKNQRKPTKELSNYREVHAYPLSTSLTEVLAAIQGKEFVKYPSPMKSPPNTHTKKNILFVS